MTQDTEAERFAEWFRQNYPGPDTIIGRPDWHAPKIYRAATHELRKALEAAEAERDALREALAPFAALPDPRNSGAKRDVDPVWGVNGVCLTVGDFRRARALTGEAKP